MRKVLVTGSAGFIGFHTASRLLAEGEEVVGADNLNSYYDVDLKIERNNLLRKSSNYFFECSDLADEQRLQTLCAEHHVDTIIHLAAQPGVRYSLEEPKVYIESNVKSFLSILETCRHQNITHLVYASSSSVYGANRTYPFLESHNTDHPISLYAATKKSNELMAHVYSHLFETAVTGLRFFTVYGPWGRPDMALFKFTKSILAGQPIEVYNHGKMRRDFTYIDDIVDGILLAANNPPRKGKASCSNSLANGNLKSEGLHCQAAPFELYNIGAGSPVPLLEMIKILEGELRTKAKIKFVDMQPGDVEETFASTQKLAKIGYAPSTTLQEGIARFVHWYREFYGVDGRS